MAACILHAGKFAEGGSCPRCKSCRHSSVWKKVENGVMDKEWRCNGCVNRLKAVPNGNKGGEDLMYLYEGAWVESSLLKPCANCEKPYLSERRSSQYCSDPCRVAASRKVKK